jgi:hypothetical protein
MEMWFHRKPEVGSLNPEGFADPSNFRRHTPLIFKSEKVLDHGVAESDVEAMIGEPTEIGCITCEWLDVVVRLFFDCNVQGRDLDIPAASPAPLLPESLSPSHVQNAYGSRKRRDQGLEPSEPPGAQFVRKRIRIIDICKFPNQRS